MEIVCFELFLTKWPEKSQITGSFEGMPSIMWKIIKMILRLLSKTIGISFFRHLGRIWAIYRNKPILTIILAENYSEFLSYHKVWTKKKGWRIRRKRSHCCISKISSSRNNNSSGKSSSLEYWWRYRANHRSKTSTSYRLSWLGALFFCEAEKRFFERTCLVEDKWWPIRSKQERWPNRSEQDGRANRGLHG